MTVRRWNTSVVLAGLGLLVVAGLWGGCGSTAGLDSPNAGRTTAYQPGAPDFDMEAIGAVRDGTAGIDLYLGIPHVSLIFVQQDSSTFAARYEVLIRLLDRDGKGLLDEITVADTVRLSTYEATREYDPLTLRERLPVAPGEYVVEVTLFDRASDREAQRRQRVTVLSPTAPQPALSRIRIEGQRDDPSFTPVVSLHVPSDMDSVRAIAQLVNADRLPRVEVAMRLLRFPSDTTIARPPQWISPSRGSLIYRGVRYDRPDTLQTTRWDLPDPGETVRIEFTVPRLREGVYRVVIEAGEPGATEAVLRQERDFTVRAPSFPRITAIGQLVDALAYIAREGEYEHLQAAETPAEQKRRFDAFWGEHIPNRQEARNVIRTYYARVEEANLFFSTYKDGWKTDRGMLYIVLGAPLYVDRRIDSEVWVYSYGQRDESSVFVFERVPIYGSKGSFYNHILQRDMMHDYRWRRILERWRNGEVL